MSSSSGLIRGAGGAAAADKTRDGGVPAFEKYLPEITDAIQETCAARGRAANALGRRGASAAQPESGAFEALLCAGALAQSVGPAWEPHARVLLPSLFAGVIRAAGRGARGDGDCAPGDAPADSEEAHRRH